MKKNSLFFAIILSFSCVYTGYASSSLRCRLLNSKKCATLKGFEKGYRQGCAGESSNCLKQFCKAQCIKDVGDDVILGHTCKKHCTTLLVLASLPAESRRKFYDTFDAPTYQEAYLLEWAVKDRLEEKKKNKKWWSRSRNKNERALMASKELLTELGEKKTKAKEATPPPPPPQSSKPKPKPKPRKPKSVVEGA